MRHYKELLRTLRGGAYDQALDALYPSTDTALARALRVAEGLGRTFSPDHTARCALFTSPGRTELGGNHTDHQHGHVLCGSIDLDMLCCAAENGTSFIRVCSEGYAPVTVALDVLESREEERESTAALVRGVAAGVAALGYSLSGFDAYISSAVPAGSGLSSSAAFEILIGSIFNHFFCGGQLDAVTLAKIGQRAENDYFGKPCGLMDQMGSAVGGAVSIDFADPDEPVLTRVEYDFSRSGHTLCIVDTGSSHADLTDDYAAIPREMGDIASFFDKTVLREVPEEAFWRALPELREYYGDRAVLRALHYYDDDRVALAETAALQAGDFPRFLKLVNASGLSSALHLQNTWSPADPQQQAIPITLAVGREALRGEGALRVHGGGFAGTIQAFVPDAKLDAFKDAMGTLLGPGKCHVLRIRPQGGGVIDV